MRLKFWKRKKKQPAQSQPTPAPTPTPTPTPTPALAPAPTPARMPQLSPEQSFQTPAMSMDIAPILQTRAQEEALARQFQTTLTQAGEQLARRGLASSSLTGGTALGLSQWLSSQVSDLRRQALMQMLGLRMQAAQQLEGALSRLAMMALQASYAPAAGISALAGEYGGMAWERLQQQLGSIAEMERSQAPTVPPFVLSATGLIPQPPPSAPQSVPITAMPTPPTPLPLTPNLSYLTTDLSAYYPLSPSLPSLPQPMMAPLPAMYR